MDAEGNILTASAEENSDLLAALCGAGNGNYGAPLPLQAVGRAAGWADVSDTKAVVSCCAYPGVPVVHLFHLLPCPPLATDAGIVTDFTIKLWDLPPGNLTLAEFTVGALRDNTRFQWCLVHRRNAARLR